MTIQLTHGTTYEMRNNSVCQSMAIRYPSICIPRVDATITKDYIYKTFCSLKIGKISNIYEIPLRNDPTHKRIIIKIKWDQTSEAAQKIENTLVEKGSIKLVHDMPWFWKICPAR